MADTKIICTLLEQKFNYNTNKYVTIEEVTKTITEEIYDNMTSEEATIFFRGLGGTEKVTRKGGRVTKLVSTSPSREFRKIRTFTFSE